MNVLVINCGSSSVKADIREAKSGRRVAHARVERVGSAAACLRLGSAEPRPCDALTYEAAVAHVTSALLAALPPGARVEAVGHRVVHGGERFTASTLITPAVEEAIEALIPLAPLHNPANLAGIRGAKAALPDAHHIAVFDTAFHATLPRRAQQYALPQELVKKHTIRRYGFHGISHRDLAERAAAFLGEELKSLRIITCHLGGGCSACAVEYGRSIETTMGMTPLEGLVMGARSGDLDPGVILHLMRAEGLDANGMEDLLNRKSGLAGLSGTSGDLRDIMAKAAEGDEGCRQAIQVFSHRLRKTLGAYAAVMGGVDAIVFSGGIGENSAEIRHRAAQRLEYLGARLDEDRNREAKLTEAAPIVDIAQAHSRARILVALADEEGGIVREVAGVVALLGKAAPGRHIPIAVSARHVHLDQAAVEALFGAGHALTPTKPLSQPGQFACAETVTLVGPRRSLEGVRVLGPARGLCQVEISRTDEFHLGIDAPVRASGDIANTPGIKLVGTKGSLELKQGVICAWRHIHMTPQDADAFGVVDKDVVEVAVESSGRSLIFGDVLVRVSKDYALEMHIDTDEANAAEIQGGMPGELRTSGALGALRQRSTSR
jgi:acetate kinase